MVIGRRFSILLIASTSLIAACATAPPPARAPAEPVREQADPVSRSPGTESVPKKKAEATQTQAARRDAPEQPKLKKADGAAKSTGPAPAVKQPVEDKRPAKVDETEKRSPAVVEVAPPVTTQAAPYAQTIPAGTVTGRIRLLGKDGEAIDSSGVIINLEPINKIALPTTATKEHFISMVDKTYTPAVMTMKENDTLSFVNGDKIKHNVFSSSGDNTFDLGTYGTGKTRSVKLGSSGVVKVYCNIHPEMATFVNVSEHNIATITDEGGGFQITSVPAGQYKVRVWHVRGELERDLTVKADTPAKLELIMDTSSYQRTPHKNKFGKDYKKKPALFEDEFY